MARPGHSDAATGHRRDAILVLGMHRSGTSAMTRVLNLLGASLPSELKEGGKDDPTGLWESRRIVSAHDDLLASLALAWDDVATLPAGWVEREGTREHERALLELLVEDLAGARLFAVKDPRASRLVPLWLRLLEGLGADPHFVLIVRHPLEVARSLAARNGFGEQKSLLLWLVHLVEAERDTRGHPRIFVDYEQLLREPDLVLDRLPERLGLPGIAPTADLRARIRAFLSAGHRHQVAEAEIASGPTDLRDWVRDAYELALRTALDGSAEADARAHRRFDTLGRHLRTVQLVVPVANEARGASELRLELARREERIRLLKAKNDDLGERLARSEAKRREALLRLAEVERSLGWRLTVRMRGRRGRPAA